ncbi:phage terminase large subunit [Bacillus badius]|uniref:Phage terminase, large subunit n=1 Tax=Bacillus badius TaxID=1455 RepID=A0ABR5AP90_BACBA|nr:phage terminase large subunit [Bacillus badius]KIL72702.1 Phage terminase, large subunit [Bacillus badius]MED4715451.1 phage terminase large subunit [Bacillus badius]
MPTLTNEQRQAIAKLAQQELARRSFRDYVVHVHRGNYTHFRHTEFICEHLEPVANGEQRFIMIEMPPRHGKSMTVTESFPSYFISKNPEKRVIAASYSDSLARKFGRLNRQKVEEYGRALFDVEISSVNAAQNNWGIQGKRGGMIATGIGGSITGEGADLLLIDDPFKNAEEANSNTIREKVWAEWESTLSTRLHKGGSVVVIMTRWHEDDIIGRLLERSPYTWQRLRLPAIAEDEDDALGREVGEPLCPELGFDEEWAENKKIEVGSRTWAALFQQRPSPAGGNIFNRHWWKFYMPEDLPRIWDKQAQSWDCTFKDSKTSDFVVGQVWGKKQANFYLLDQDRNRMNLPETLKAIRHMSEKWPDAKAKYVEDKANGPAVIQMLQDEISGLIAVNPEGGKEVRANAVSPLVEAGNVYLPHPSIAPWVNDFIEEATAFPNGKHDDMVDAATQALNKLQTAKSNPLDRYKRLMGRK